MLNDKDIAKQIMRRDVINLYRQLPYFANQLGLNISPIFGLMEDKIIDYSNTAIDVVLDWLFGNDSSGDIDEAAEIAKMISNDKIDEYRRKIREEKAKSNN